MHCPGKLLTLLLSIFLITSCSDDDKEVKPVVEFPTAFSELTPEENKANLEDNGIVLLNNLNELKSTAGIKSSISLNHFLTIAELPTLSSGRKATSTQPLSMIRELANFGTGKNSASDVLSSFRVKEGEPVEEPMTAQQMFDELVGVFVYNAADSSWTHTPLDNGKIAFQFPSTREGTSNNAEFVVYGYTSVQVDNAEAQYAGDLPTALKADLVVDNSVLVAYTFAASYKSNGEPTLVTTSLAIGTFTFAFEAKNTTTEVSVNYSLTSGDTNLLSLGGLATGNFASANVEGSTNVGSVLTKSIAYFQIMGIKFAGEVDVVSLDNAFMTAQTVEQEAAAMNEHVKLVVFYAESKEKIAETEFYGTSETESGTDCWEYDTDGDGIADAQDCQPWSYTDEYVDIRLIFADGSKADLETYTDAGFDEITAEVEAFVNAVEADLE